MSGSPPSLTSPQHRTARLHSPVVQACRTISIQRSHSLHCGIIINSHLGEGCFPRHRMQWRFIATISKGLGEMQRMRERDGKCAQYTTSVCNTTVWPCMSSEVDEKNNGWQMLRTVNEYQVLLGRQRGGGKKPRLCNTLKYVLWTATRSLMCINSSDAESYQSLCAIKMTCSTIRVTGTAFACTIYACLHARYIRRYSEVSATDTHRSDHAFNFIQYESLLNLLIFSGEDTMSKPEKIS